MEPNSGQRQGSSKVLLIALIAVILSIAVVLSLGYSQVICPGCNTPETLSVDHYTIQTRTNQTEPSLFTVWFRSFGRSGQSMSVLTLYLKDTTGYCSSGSLNPATLANDSSQHPFQVGGVTIKADSLVPVSIDTASSGFYFTRGHCYGLTVVTDKIDIEFPGIQA